MSIEAVIFDFGGVLCFHPPEERYAKMAKSRGVPVDVFIPAFWADRVEYDAGRLTPEEYWKLVAQRAGFALDRAELPELVRWEVELWNMYDERVLGYAATLQAHGVRTAILSNLPRDLGEELRITPGFLDCFDHVTFSHELSLVKPQPGIYQDTLRGLDVAPGAALFLDDRSENVEGARAVGLQAEVYSTWENFVEQSLGRYGLPTPDDARRQ